MTQMPLTWIFKHFDELSPAELYSILQLRNEVFVVEQNCIYQDADGKDPECWHLAGWEGAELVACARIIPPGISYSEASIGRVVTSPRHRRSGAGKELMRLSIEKTFWQFNCAGIRIGAQLYLTRFYESLGFRQTGDQYLEDGILHIEMILSK